MSTDGCRQRDAAPCPRSHGSVTLHPVHVSVLRTHSVRTGSLLSHTKEIKSVIYIQSCVRPHNVKHLIKHNGRTHWCATTIGHFLISGITFQSVGECRHHNYALRIMHYALKKRDAAPCPRFRAKSGGCRHPPLQTKFKQPIVGDGVSTSHIIPDETSWTHTLVRPYTISMLISNDTVHGRPLGVRKTFNVHLYITFFVGRRDAVPYIR